MNDILVAKIGGSTFGSRDTTLEDVVALQRRGMRPVVVHGGGSLISEWLTLHNIETHFERGLRVTDEQTLTVVVAVLAGAVNKAIVASLSAVGAQAVGLCGADGGLLRAKLLDKKLGLVGDIVGVDTSVLLSLRDNGMIPVIAPIAVRWEDEKPTGDLLNINGDIAAGAIAEALKARWLVFLTDVSGVRSAAGETLSRLSSGEARALTESGVIEGGMIPKVDACVRAAGTGCVSIIADGRKEHVLLSVAEGAPVGTLVG